MWQRQLCQLQNRLFRLLDLEQYLLMQDEPSVLRQTPVLAD